MHANGMVVSRPATAADMPRSARSVSRSGPMPMIAMRRHSAGATMPASIVRADAGARTATATSALQAAAQAVGGVGEQAPPRRAPAAQRVVALVHQADVAARAVHPA